MFLKQQLSNDPCSLLAERIKNDLFQIFKRKGLEVSTVEIDMQSDSINVSVCISKDEILSVVQ